MPNILYPREDFSLIYGPDKRLYAIGGSQAGTTNYEVFDFET